MNEVYRRLSSEQTPLQPFLPTTPPINVQRRPVCSPSPATITSTEPLFPMTDHHHQNSKCVPKSVSIPLASQPLNAPSQPKPTSSPPQPKPESNDACVNKQTQIRNYINYCRNLQESASSNSQCSSRHSSSNDLVADSGGGLGNGMTSNFDSRIHFLLETWLENEFQQNFKQLHFLVKNDLKHCLSNGNVENSTRTSNIENLNQSEILFARHHGWNSKGRACDSTDMRKKDPIEKNASQIRKSGLQTQASYVQLTNWLLNRRNSASHLFASKRSRQGRTKVLEKKVNLCTGTPNSPEQFPVIDLELTDRKVSNVPPQRPVSMILEQNVSEYHHPKWFSDRLKILNQQLLTPSVPISDMVPNRCSKGENLICLCLTQPNDKLKRDSLIYAYPPISSEQCSNLDTLVKLGGMFVTLSEMMSILSTSAEDSLHFSSLEFAASSTCSEQYGASSPENLTQSGKYHLSFVLEKNVTYTANDQKSRMSTMSVPLLLVVVLPSHKYSQVDTHAVAELVRNAIYLRFGSLADAFSPFLHSSANVDNFKYLDRVLFTLETLLTPRLNFVESTLNFSNTFFVSLSSSADEHHRTSRSTALVLQQLSVDEPTSIHLCNYLNDYDSLDWLDESINFYKDGTDIERALSEHFARCIQFGSSLDCMGADKPLPLPTQPPTIPSKSVFAENNLYFDLLELELSSFVVVGSCLFYRGLFVQSHLAPLYLNSIRHILFTRGLMAATKYHAYDLVYFSRFYPIEGDRKKVINQDPTNDQFLLVIGYGHLLHCSLVNVHLFDRSYYQHLNCDYGITIDTSDSAKSKAVQLPSSFAFYVFIKESFRLLCLYLERFAFLEQLDQSFRLGKQISSCNLMPSFEFLDHNLSRSNSLRKRIKKLKNLLRSTKPNKSDDSNSNPPNDSVVHKKSTDQNHSNSARSGQVPFSCSCSEVSSLASADLRWGPSSLDGSSSLQSVSTDSVHTGATFDSISFNYNSVYRFSHDYLPESLVCYLNIESRQQLETFHGPILDALEDFGDDGFGADSSNDRLVAAITSNICGAIQEMRCALRRHCQIRLARRHKTRRAVVEGVSDCDPSKYTKSSSTKSGRIIELNYDSKGQPVSQSEDRAFGFRFYLLGQCSIVTDATTGLDSIGDEFYACFKLNSSTASRRKNSLPIHDRSRWNVKSFLSPSTSKRATAGFEFCRQPSGGKRSLDYELSRLDFLLVDLDELVQSVRLANWR